MPRNQPPGSFARAIPLGLAGAVLLAVTVTSSSASIEHFLLGESDGRLAWGPTLFRVMLGVHGLALLAAAALATRRATRRPAPPRPKLGPLGPANALGLVILCVVALVLRLIRLNTDLWLDELLTYVDFAALPLGQQVTTFPNQNQHMLYTVMAHFTMGLFGADFAGFRMPAVLFGVGSLPFLFLLGRRTNGTREAWLATILMTFAYHHVWFSQNARGYSGLLFFTLAATWLLIVALERRRTGYWVAYSACLALGLWVHMTMLFVALAHAAAYGLELTLDLAQGRRDRGRAVPCLVPVVLAWFFGATLTAQLYALSLPEFFSSALHEVSLESDWTNPLWVVQEMVARLRDVGVIGFGAFIGLGVMVLGWMNLFGRDRVAALSMALPGLLGGATMLALGHNLWPRFFFFCAGFILLTLVRGAFRTPEFVAGFFVNRDRAAMWGRRVGTAGMVVLIAAALWTLPNVYRYPKQDYSGARDFVLEEMGPRDAAASVGLAGTAYGRYFAPDWPVPETAEELDGLVSTHRTVWLIYTLSIQLKAWHPDIWETVQRDFEVVRVFPGTLGGGEVIVSRSLPGTGDSP